MTTLFETSLPPFSNDDAAAAASTAAADAASAAEAMEIDNHYAASKKKESVTESKTTTTTTTVATTNAAAVEGLYSPELLQMYYSRLFPFSMLHSWLSYGSNNTTFSRREFSFTIEPQPGEEIYIRYQSFTSEHELAQAILKRRPTKIDIGAVFSHAPKDHHAIQKSRFLPVQRELVFDIDLTDYDDIRCCGCAGATICAVCWGFMKIAVHVMDQGLRQDFGFEHIAWFYSGRRGVHAWVCDETARQLTDAGRSAVASYFEVSECVCVRERERELVGLCCVRLSRRSTSLLRLFYCVIVIVGREL